MARPTLRQQPGALRPRGRSPKPAERPSGPGPPGAAPMGANAARPRRRAASAGGVLSRGPGRSVQAAAAQRRPGGSRRRRGCAPSPRSAAARQSQWRSGRPHRDERARAARDRARVRGRTRGSRSGYPLTRAARARSSEAVEPRAVGPAARLGPPCCGWPRGVAKRPRRRGATVPGGPSPQEAAAPSRRPPGAREAAPGCRRGSAAVAPGPAAAGSPGRASPSRTRPRTAGLSPGRRRDARGGHPALLRGVVDDKAPSLTPDGDTEHLGHLAARLVEGVAVRR